MTVNDILLGISESKALKYFREMEHGIFIFVASGKQGKSAALHTLVSICWPSRPVYLLDIPDVDASVFPGYRLAVNVDAIPPGSIAVIEDVNRLFASRGSKDNKLLQMWLGIISHKEIIVLITTQCLSSTDIEFLRSQDCILCHKKMFSEDVQFERKEFRMVQVAANMYLEKAAELFPQFDRRSWIFFDRWNEVVTIPLVSWWDHGTHACMLRNVRVTEAS